MAEALVSQVQKELVDFAIKEIKKHGKLVIDTERDIEKLISTFKAIGALLLDAEEKQLKSDGIRDWLEKLKDVSYEIDDVLDEWRTEILKRQLDGDDDAAGGGCLEVKLLQIFDVLKRVCPFLPTYCFSPTEIGFRYDIGSTMKTLNERLDDIDKEKNLYTLNHKETASYSSLQTGPTINFSEVKGREEELKFLQHRLLDDGSDHPGVRSVSIQGTGGFGKTTLAKMLYNDKALEAHFDKRVWVCVSNNFDQATVAKSILESFKKYTPRSTFPHMLEEIKAHTEGKKFLLVLDDVWEDNRSNWDELISSVSHGLPGSKILLTTRKEEVSRVFHCVDDDILLIQKISENVCRGIFTQIAFNGWRAEEKECVKDLCGRAVQKCYGSPLAAKVLGGVLGLKRSKRAWIQLLRSEMWEMKEGREEVLAPIALSYYDLPPTLRQCFQFCSVFPQDYKMQKDKLIKLWMSQGFLKATTNQDMEEVGEEYFQMLVMRSFFQDVETEKVLGEEITLCKMHDFVHDFARLTTNKVRHLMVEYKSSEGTNNLISSVSSHLSSTKRNNYLRSFAMRDGIAIGADVYAGLRGLRSLILYSCYYMEEIPSTIAQLIHLRHLDLSCNHYLEELAEEICELYNLETLLLNNNKRLKMLPSVMGNKLVNLKHLENYRVPAVLPRSMARLGNSLKTLTTFHVEADAEGGSNIGDLECMNRIQGSLTITGLSRVTNCAEVKRAELAKKESLTSLQLEFNSREEKENWADLRVLEGTIPSSTSLEHLSEASDKEEQVLEAIIPSSTSLEHLFVKNYQGGSICPSWLMSLSNLTSLTFMRCPEVEHLPPFGALPSLEELHLFALYKVKKVGLEFLLETSVIQQLRMGNINEGDQIIAFPKLTRLSFFGLKNWEVWDLEGAGMLISSMTTVMPRLRRFELTLCRKLEKLPDVLLQKTTLEKLEIYKSSGLGNYMFNREDPEMMPNDVWDKISHIPTILLHHEDVRTMFKSEIEAMSGIGCSNSKPGEEEAGHAADDDDGRRDQGKSSK